MLVSGPSPGIPHLITDHPRRYMRFLWDLSKSTRRIPARISSF
jgi:hypothetical protein